MRPTLKSLMPVFLDDDRAYEYLKENYVFYVDLPCPSCARSMNVNKKEKRFTCRRRGCRKNISKNFGSFFSGHKLPYGDILLLAYFWLAKCGVSTVLEMTEHSPNTICNMWKYFRQLISSNVGEEDIKICGEGIIVEIDEAKFGKRKYHRGHRIEGVWVFGGVERTPERKMFVSVVEDRTAETLEAVIKQYIKPGSIVYSDLWKGYA